MWARAMKREREEQAHKSPSSAVLPSASAEQMGITFGKKTPQFTKTNKKSAWHGFSRRLLLHVAIKEHNFFLEKEKNQRKS